MSTITISTDIHAPLAFVWELFTLPEHIVKWNAASDDWETTSATNDLTPGGKFSFHMAAKDKSFGFDFGGTYDEIKPLEHIAYTLQDHREVSTKFLENNNTVTIVQSFEIETTHTEEMQRAGWQAILDNFKKYVELQP
ncbi:SRPBCC domain-containing protein [Sphingobacterium sp. SRCM116780]|uniref:SRPBCC domain-containing protein n=1 Tax=Sphingobacterium sp. SRCM116780 TaxID=2907623 RepID=UPI001F206803|nr:SRPBCC domain-containing protein [Sphingobacterium sp. SRCM116780]UIR55004.1 SRPBCC domain-containing protein [Sphingobacterium sp. SRCM116780]